ncbi:Uridylate kinase [Candidatus Mycoplasma haematolamae str. Purdue]|uniref:Uridylate kinase n=1 Tax=Mycoplasma haematolamae (strain Purdue) TaxID=1212765 RepID=I7C5T0_MYCHA|nr:UMP kinase [Candidatus Mycoplasma haematolamae]AFO51872.1 Uridylate kinase [Candidatus Mycoplasma haematolamae str. Purdue]
MKKERLLLKFSGGALSSESEVFSESKLLDLASQVRELSEDYEIGIVVGGGNIWRGKDGRISFMTAPERDYMGMISTVLNGFVLQKALRAKGVESRLFSATGVERVTEDYNLFQINKALESGQVVIFSGGVGEPQFSTDSGCAIRAIEIGATRVLIGKEGVEGIYNKDPNVHSNAVFYDKITYDRLIAEDIRILDQSSLSLCRDNKLHLLIFSQEVENAFIKALKGGIKMSEVV